MSKPSSLFLTKVKVHQFAEGVKKSGKIPFVKGYWKSGNYRILHRTQNLNPNTIYTVIGVTGIREGYSDYLGPEEGHAWVQHASHKVYVVANSIGRKYKVLEADMEVLEEWGPSPILPFITVQQREKEIRDYLDGAIRKWRTRAKNEKDSLYDLAPYYIDAFQSMRVSIFGELLPPGGIMNDIIKPAEPTDNPGEIIAAMMPTADSPPTRMWMAGKPPKPVVPCPICGKKCLVFMDLLKQVKAMFPGRAVPTCVHCAIKSNARSGTLPKWLKEQGKTPDQVFEEVMKQAEKPKQEESL